jgi:hypothetical protein
LGSHTEMGGFAVAKKRHVGEWHVLVQDEFIIIRQILNIGGVFKTGKIRLVEPDALDQLYKFLRRNCYCKRELRGGTNKREIWIGD